MDRFAKLVSGVALVLTAFSAHAGYAQLSPPPGWSGGASGGQFAYGPAANTATIANGTVRTNAALNVGGRSVSIPASMRFAANAPRIAAAAIFMNPYLRAGLGIAAWLATAGIVWDAASGKWQAPETSYPVSDGYGWWTYNISSPMSNPQQACAAVAGPTAVVSGPYADGTMGCSKKLTSGSTEWVTTMRKTTMSSCPAGWFVTPAGCVQTSPPKQLTEKEMVDLLNPANTPGWPMPDSVPMEMPAIPLIVEIPVINPDTGVNPFPRPMFVPTGDPVPNPNYDPNLAPSPSNQPFLQPGIRVVPSPAPGSPWQVDLQPVNRPKAESTPNPNPQTDAQPNPGDKPAPENEPDLCEKYPDILSCQKLDEPEDKDLESIEKPISITPDSGWGAENAACPAPKMLQVQGRQIPIPYDLFCTYMQGMRPIIIAMAWLSAAFILIGARETS